MAIIFAQVRHYGCFVWSAYGLVLAAFGLFTAAAYHRYYRLRKYKQCTQNDEKN